MKTDRDLLEAAAQAAGMSWLNWTPGAAPLVPAEHRAVPDRGCWHPLTDDGDALRLAVKLQIQITPGTYNKDEFTAFRAAGGEAHEHWSTMQDEYAATRRAIVRAAAAMAKED